MRTVIPAERHERLIRVVLENLRSMRLTQEQFEYECKRDFQRHMQANGMLLVSEITMVRGESPDDTMAGLFDHLYRLEGTFIKQSIVSYL